MVTRRTILKGTAAGSIAAIASAHGAKASAAGAPPNSGVGAMFGAGYGILEGGAVGGFLKVTDGFNVFFKWDKTGAEVFMKEDVVGLIDTHIKFFDKAWSGIQYLDSFEGNLDEAVGGFYKLDAGAAGIFFKYRTLEGDDHFRYLNVYANGGYDTEPPDDCNDG